MARLQTRRQHVRRRTTFRSDRALPPVCFADDANAPLPCAYGNHRRTTRGLTRDHCPLSTLRTFVSLLPLAALTFPPTPFLSRTAGAEGGMLPTHLPFGPLPLLHGERKGGCCPRTFPLALFRSSTASGRGDAAPDLPFGSLPLLHGERKG
jgi:hypothetical protein